MRARKCSLWAAIVLSISLGITTKADVQVAAANGLELLDAPPFTVGPKDLTTVAGAVSVQDGAQLVILLEETTISFDDQGQYTRRFHLIYKILAPGGVDGWDRVSATWEPWHQKKPEIEARVVTPDLIVHELDQKTLVESGDANVDGKVYSDRRHLRGPLPAVQSGSIIEATIEHKEFAPFFTGGLVRQIVFGNSAPTERTRLILEAPVTSALRYEMRLLDDVKPLRVEQNGRIRLEFLQGPVKPLDKVEEYLPSDVPQWPCVTFSTGRSWQEVAASYDKIVAPQMQSGISKNILLQATNGKKNRSEIADALLNWIHKEIRYTGVEFGRNSIVPASIREILGRKYGDCKEQAMLLVTMLREAGIESYMALLETGPDMDSLPSLPGLGLFDHAIVYLPPSGQAPALWIDPTDEFARPGELAPGSQGRLALIIAKSSMGLTKTPDATPSDNRIVEKREYFLSENGPARVVETTTLHGYSERAYRRNYRDAKPEDIQKTLEKYVKGQYQAKKLGSYETSNVTDLSTPFRLKLEAIDVERAKTDTTAAVVYLAHGSLLERLPSVALEKGEGKDRVSGHRKEDGSKEDSAGTRKNDFLLPLPCITEWDCHIIPPPGFRPSALPDSGQDMLGPAVLTKTFTQNPDGSLTVSLVFDTVKRRLTPEEFANLRDACVKLQEGEAIKVTFAQVGEAYLTAGDYGKALTEFRRLANQHPKEALHRIQISRALLNAGLGEAARREAKDATELEPQSKDAWANLGWTLEHDLMGRRFRDGFDYDGAITAYQRAQSLDPGDLATTADLAILLEHDVHGVRYSREARMDEAIKEYEKAKDKLDGTGLANNLPFALFYAHRFSQLREYLPTLKSSLTLQALDVAATAAMNGTQPGIEDAEKLIAGEEDRRKALLAAGGHLMKIRLYPQSAELLSAGAKGRDDSAAMLARSEVIRNAAPYEELYANVDSPEAVAWRFIVASQFRGGTGDYVQYISSSGIDEAKDKSVQRKYEKEWFSIETNSRDNSIPPEVFIDLAHSAIKFAIDGEDAFGYRVRTIAMNNGSDADIYYVVKEGGQYKILGTQGEADIGKWILPLIASGKLADAKRWLDWARDEWQATGGDDPLAGADFPRFWAKGDADDPQKMRLAAAALIGSGVNIDLARSIFEPAREKVTDEALRADIDRALIRIYFKKGMNQEALALSKELMRIYPRSDVAFTDTVDALTEMKRWGEVQDLVQSRLKTSPDDTMAIRKLLGAAYELGHPDIVRKQLSRLVELGKANDGDFNEAAWSDLYGTPPIKTDTLELARQAVAISDNSDWNSLHTLATVYAEMGKAAEAKEILCKVMDVDAETSPSQAVWLVLGRIASQYGERDIAMAAYKGITKPDNSSGTYTLYALASRYIKELESGKAKEAH